MGRIVDFEALQLNVELPTGWFYHDGGYSDGTLALLDPYNDEVQIPEVKVYRTVRSYIRRAGIYKGLQEEEAERRAEHEALKGSGLLRLAYTNSFQGGSCLVYGPENYGRGLETHIHIFYRDYGVDSLNFFTRGHEEGHALMAFAKGIDTLKTKLQETSGLEIDIENIKDQELVADCAGFAALDTHNLTEKVVEKFRSRSRGKLSQHLRARYIYETGNTSWFGFMKHQLFG